MFYQDYFKIFLRYRCLSIMLKTSKIYSPRLSTLWIYLWQMSNSYQTYSQLSKKAALLGMPPEPCSALARSHPQLLHLKYMMFVMCDVRKYISTHCKAEWVCYCQQPLLGLGFIQWNRWNQVLMICWCWILDVCLYIRWDCQPGQ